MLYQLKRSCDPLHHSVLNISSFAELNLDLVELLAANKMSIKDLQDSVANLIAVVLGTASFSNHLCLHFLMPEELLGTYAPGSLVRPKESFTHATMHTVKSA